jgi:hypothetical protein
MEADARGGFQYSRRVLSSRAGADFLARKSKTCYSVESLSYVELLYSSLYRLVVGHRHMEAATSIT